MFVEAGADPAHRAMWAKSSTPPAAANDQVALDLRMYLKDQIDEITALVKDVLWGDRRAGGE